MWTSGIKGITPSTSGHPAVTNSPARRDFIRKRNVGYLLAYRESRGGNAVRKSPVPDRASASCLAAVFRSVAHQQQ